MSIDGQSSDGDLLRATRNGDGAAFALFYRRHLPRQRAAITARIVQEREYAEIAAQLECSEMVVRQQVSRGLTRLRDRFKEGPR